MNDELQLGVRDRRHWARLGAGRGWHEQAHRHTQTPQLALVDRLESADPKAEDEVDCSRRVRLHDREQGDELAPQSMRDGHQLHILHAAHQRCQASLRVRELLLATIVINPLGPGMRKVPPGRPCGGTRHRCRICNAGGMGVGTTQTGGMGVAHSHRAVQRESA